MGLRGRRDVLPVVLVVGGLLAGVILLGLDREQAPLSTPPPATVAAPAGAPQTWPKSPPTVSAGQRVARFSRSVWQGLVSIGQASWQGLRDADHWIRDHMW